MKELRIPSELRIHFVPAQPAFDRFDWVPNGPNPEPRSARRPEEAGKFCSNNGMLVVYDEVGDPFVVPYRELERHGITAGDVDRTLRYAGFEGAYVYVPHSNDGGSWACQMWQEAYQATSAT